MKAKAIILSLFIIYLLFSLGNISYAQDSNSYLRDIILGKKSPPSEWASLLLLDPGTDSATKDKIKTAIETLGWIMYPDKASADKAIATLEALRTIRREDIALIDKSIERIGIWKQSIGKSDQAIIDHLNSKDDPRLIYQIMDYRIRYGSYPSPFNTGKPSRDVRGACDRIAQFYNKTEQVEDNLFLKLWGSIVTPIFTAFIRPTEDISQAIRVCGSFEWLTFSEFHTWAVNPSDPENLAAWQNNLDSPLVAAQLIFALFDPNQRNTAMQKAIETMQASGNLDYIPALMLAWRNEYNRGESDPKIKKALEEACLALVLRAMGEADLIGLLALDFVDQQTADQVSTSGDRDIWATLTFVLNLFQQFDDYVGKELPILTRALRERMTNDAIIPLRFYALFVLVSSGELTLGDLDAFYAGLEEALVKSGEMYDLFTTHRYDRVGNPYDFVARRMISLGDNLVEMITAEQDKFARFATNKVLFENDPIINDILAAFAAVVNKARPIFDVAYTAEERKGIVEEATQAITASVAEYNKGVPKGQQITLPKDFKTQVETTITDAIAAGEDGTFRIQLSKDKIVYFTPFKQIYIENIKNLASVVIAVVVMNSNDVTFLEGLVKERPEEKPVLKELAVGRLYILARYDNNTAAKSALERLKYDGLGLERSFVVRCLTEINKPRGGGGSGGILQPLVDFFTITLNFLTGGFTAVARPIPEDGTVLPYSSLDDITPYLIMLQDIRDWNNSGSGTIPQPPQTETGGGKSW